MSLCHDPHRQTGKTTRLWERAIDAVAEGHNVYITGPHRHWLLELGRRFKAEGLVSVEVVTLQQIENGWLRGRTGRLLVDDYHDLSYRERRVVDEEAEILRVRS